MWCVEVGAIETQIKEAKARKKRSSVPVVGDMSSLADNLPTFELLLDRATVQSRLHTESVSVVCNSVFLVTVWQLFMSIISIFRSSPLS